MSAIKYKVSDANSIAFIELIQSESKIDFVKAENAFSKYGDSELVKKANLDEDTYLPRGLAPYIGYETLVQ